MERTEYNVSPEVFIQTWQDSESVAEVSGKTRMPIPICNARASKYRKMGVKLKPMPRRSSRRLDVAGMNDLIDRLERPPVKPLSPREARQFLREAVLS